MAKKITLEEFKERVKNRFPTESFTILHYVKSGAPLDIQCDTCKTVYHISAAGNFLAPNKRFGCVNCHGFWKEREKVMKELEERYEILDKYVKNTHYYYKLKCKKCGHIRETSFQNFKKNLECGCETGVYRNRTAQEFINEVNNHAKEPYELVSEYVNQNTIVLLRHSCGFIWKVRPGDVLKGRSYCPKCGHIQSKGERLITGILKELEISFEPEKRLEDSLQRFDFYIELNDKKYAIEYQGRQHFEYSEFMHKSEEGFQHRLALDEKKRQYCKDNQILLLEIPYTDSNEEVKNKIIDFLGLSSTTIPQGSTLQAIGNGNNVQP